MLESQCFDAIMEKQTDDVILHGNRTMCDSVLPGGRNFGQITPKELCRKKRIGRENVVAELLQLWLKSGRKGAVENFQGLFF
jgi:hypothetical protein